MTMGASTFIYTYIKYILYETKPHFNKKSDFIKKGAKKTGVRTFTHG